MKITFIFLSILFMSTSIIAQNNLQLLKHIAPNNIVIIADVAPYATYQKLDEATRKEIDITPKIADLLLAATQGNVSPALEKKVVEQLNNPQEIGLELKKDIFAWAQTATNPKAEVFEGEVSPIYLHMGMSITDEAKFTAFLEDLYGKEAFSEALFKEGNAQNIIKNNVLINWNKERVFLVRSSVKESFFEEADAYAARINSILTMQASYLGTPPAEGKSIADNADFQNHIQHKSDLSFWMNFGQLVKEVPMNEIPREGREVAMSLLRFMTDVEVAGYIHINKDNILLQQRSYLSQSLTNASEAATKIKPNRKLFKYIKGDQLMAFYAGHSNLKAYLETFSKELSSVLNQTKEGVVINNLWDILDIVIDEDEIHSLWNGDIVMAVTGLKEIQKTSINYNYNEVEDTWDEKEVTKQITMPIGLLAGSYTSEENIQKFIKLGETVGGLSKKGDGLYAIAGSQEELGISIFIVIQKGVLMITNDSTIAVDRKTYKGKEKFPVAEWKKVLSYTQYGFIDLQKSAEVITNHLVDNDKKAPKEIEKAGNTISRVEIRSYKPEGNQVTNEIKVLFANPDKNVLTTIGKIMKKIAPMIPSNLLNMGGGAGATEEFDDFEEEFKKM